MAELWVGKSMNDEDVLWRYLPIEGLVNLLDSGSLYFSTLDAYNKSDPFEGYLPKVAIDAISGASLLSVTQINATIDELLLVRPELSEGDVRPLRNHARGMQDYMRRSLVDIIKCTTVNCWNRSAHESEAMWGLYSRNGVAIQTSVKSLRHALLSNTQPHKVTLGAIKYIDFADSSLTAHDCVTIDGFLIGMIKRIAYAHENEVRMMMPGAVNHREPGKSIPKPNFLNVDLSTLIERLVISPYATPAVRNSIRAIARKYTVDESKIHESRLLENCEYLLDAYKN